MTIRMDPTSLEMGLVRDPKLHERIEAYLEENRHKVKYCNFLP